MRFLFVFLVLFVPLSLFSQDFSINWLQAVRYREIIRSYDVRTGRAEFSSDDARSPIQFEGNSGTNSRLLIRILDPSYTSSRQIKRASISIYRRNKENSIDFPWTSSNGLLTTYNFTPEHDKLFRFMVENASGDTIMLFFYDGEDKLINEITLTKKQARNTFLALKLYREIAFGEVIKELLPTD
ncbi:MAG: hypothetical protein ACRC9L_02250 [Brevinema sp.]